MLLNETGIYMGQAFLKYGECCEPKLAMLLQRIKFPGLVVEAGPTWASTPSPWRRSAFVIE